MKAPPRKMRCLGRPRPSYPRPLEVQWWKRRGSPVMNIKGSVYGGVAGIGNASSHSARSHATSRHNARGGT
ncbi:uncharacterized protein N7487_010975 [Penicillium crustosum]|uniref:uncharacterized protein n=1 Tax=Penicillium crustosum TaxID=36656 RepID=UPI0023A108C4|nr:uncharacterized protein N7487_010975 [Penicillium crustosum]KAJ5393334.1 hypothetical protein N7487_010975 [Penicillium crustosum]